MVQKSEPRRRGRPRAYDPERALSEARNAFWKRGYAATSLDDLSAATAMNRPSLYAAFGDKQALYLRTLDAYRRDARAQLAERLSGERPLATELREVYDLALASYLGTDPPRGCFLIGTAVTEASGAPEVRAVLAAALDEINEGFARRFRSGRERGELPPAADPADLARIAAAMLYSLAIHARAGLPRAALEGMAAAGVRLVCGAARSERPAPQNATQRSRRGVAESGTRTRRPT
jgi:AcrR family transcriptional regulator